MSRADFHEGKSDSSVYSDPSYRATQLGNETFPAGCSR